MKPPASALLSQAPRRGAAHWSDAYQHEGIARIFVPLGQPHPPSVPGSSEAPCPLPGGASCECSAKMQPESVPMARRLARTASTSAARWTTAIGGLGFVGFFVVGAILYGNGAGRYSEENRGLLQSASHPPCSDRGICHVDRRMFAPRCVCRGAAFSCNS